MDMSDQDTGASAGLDQFFGDRVFTPYTEERRHWLQLCVCGHIATAHSESVGGAYVLPERKQKTRPDGSSYWQEERFHGCRGELRSGRFEPVSYTRDGDTAVEQINPTCPCTDFRPVAEVDRPGRYFNQRRPKDRADLRRHPLPTGMRAYRTRISKLKLADGDPAKTAAEFDRRFRWLPDARVCVACGSGGDDVWPVFDENDHSELRCSRHR